MRVPFSNVLEAISELALTQEGKYFCFPRKEQDVHDGLATQLLLQSKEKKSKT